MGRSILNHFPFVQEEMFEKMYFLNLERSGLKLDSASMYTAICWHDAVIVHLLLARVSNVRDARQGRSGLPMTTRHDSCAEVVWGCSSLSP